MSSIITNSSAMNALQTLRAVNSNLADTQNRIGTGLKINSAKDNAAYFSISQSMKGDSGTYAAIDEGLTLTKNSIATALMGADSIKDLAKQFADKVAFAQGAKGGMTEVEGDLKELVKQMKTTLSQSTFNGDDMVGAGAFLAKDAADSAPKSKFGIVVDEDAKPATATAAATAAVYKFNATGASLNADPNASTNPALAGDKAAMTRQVVTGITRAGGSDAYTVTTIEVGTVDLLKLVNDFDKISTGFAASASDAVSSASFLKVALEASNATYSKTVDAATQLGQSEKSISNQQDFLKKVTANIDNGIGAMLDADMETEAARLQALQVQQQLATQALTIANQAPQNLLSLFR